MLQSVKDFSFWFLSNLPTFLMSEPICYFLGLGLLLCVVAVFNRIIRS